MAEQIGTIVEAGYRPTKDGSKDYFCMVVDKFRYGLFDPELKHMAEANLHKRVKVIYSSDEKGRKVEVIEPLPDTQQNGNGMTKEDWAAKDRIITRTAVAKSMIEYGYSPGDDTKQHFEWWVALICGEPVTSPNGETKPASEPIEPDHKPSDAPIEGKADLAQRCKDQFKMEAKEIKPFFDQLAGHSTTSKETSSWPAEELNKVWGLILMAKANRKES